MEFSVVFNLSIKMFLKMLRRNKSEVHEEYGGVK